MVKKKKEMMLNQALVNLLISTKEQVLGTHKQELSPH